MKLHRSYSVEEAADCLGMHKNTVRTWIRAGLPIVGGRGPTLILGSELRAFLEARRKRAKRPCPLGFLFCMKCRAARPPAAGMMDYVAFSARGGNLRALCPDCLSIMHRRIKEADLARFGADLEVTRAQAPPRLSRCASASLNRDSAKDA